MPHTHVSHKKARDSGRIVPGPPAWQALRKMPQLRQNPLGLFVELTQAYGDIVRFPFLGWSVYLITHPDHIKSILQEKHQHYNKDIFDYQLLKLFLGNGLLTNDGDAWLRQRRLIQPAFHRQRVAAFGELMTQTTLAHMQRWETFARSDLPLDMTAEMMRLTLQIVCKALFGTDITDEADTIGAAFNVVNRHLAQHSSAPFCHFLSRQQAICASRKRYTPLIEWWVTLSVGAEKASKSPTISSHCCCRHEMSRQERA